MSNDQTLLFAPEPGMDRGNQSSSSAEAVMEMERVAQNLWRSIEQLPHLPFVTDRELKDKLELQIVQALQLLDSLNQAQMICSQCGGKCCRDMGCELFISEIGCCPIADFRPLLCRFQFCEKFGSEHETLIKWLRDLFVSATSHGEAGSREARALELSLLLLRACRGPEDHCPQLIENMLQITALARSGAISWQEARGQLIKEVEVYRSSSGPNQLTRSPTA